MCSPYHHHHCRTRRFASSKSLTRSALIDVGHFGGMCVVCWGSMLNVRRGFVNVCRRLDCTLARLLDLFKNAFQSFRFTIALCARYALPSPQREIEEKKQKVEECTRLCIGDCWMAKCGFVHKNVLPVRFRINCSCIVEIFIQLLLVYTYGVRLNIFTWESTQALI